MTSGSGQAAKKTVQDLLKHEFRRLLEEHQELRIEDVDRWSIEAQTAITFQAIVNLRSTGHIFKGRR